MSYGWGPSYGDPSHPTTGELPKVGDGRHGTDELRTVQIDTVSDATRPRADGTDEVARVGDGRRGVVGGLTVQIDHVRDSEARRPVGDTQLLTRVVPERRPEEPVPAAERRPEAAAARSQPVLRRQMGPDWTHMPLRLLAAAVVTLAVLGVSAASLIYIAEWINP